MWITSRCLTATTTIVSSVPTIHFFYQQLQPQLPKLQICLSEFLPAVLYSWSRSSTFVICSKWGTPSTTHWQPHPASYALAFLASRIRRILRRSTSFRRTLPCEDDDAAWLSTATIAFMDADATTNCLLINEDCRKCSHNPSSSPSILLGE